MKPQSPCDCNSINGTERSGTGGIHAAWCPSIEGSPVRWYEPQVTHLLDAKLTDDGRQGGSTWTITKLRAAIAKCRESEHA